MAENNTKQSDPIPAHLHTIRNRLNLITGTSGLLAASPALSESDRHDAKQIYQTAFEIAQDLDRLLAAIEQALQSQEK